MKHWHSGKNSSLKKNFQFFKRPHVGKKYRSHQHTNRSQRLIMIGEDHLHTIEKGAVQE